MLKKHGIGTFVSEPEASYSFETDCLVVLFTEKEGLDFVNKTLESTLIEDVGRFCPAGRRQAGGAT